MYVLGYYAQRKIHDNEDFVVAGRRLPLSLAWMTLLATWFGAGTMLTAADEVRHEGLRAAALDPFGAGLCLLLAGAFVAGPMWRMGLLTVPDFFRRRFGGTAELVSALVLVPSYFGWIAAQFVALAEMLELFFDMPRGTGIALVALVGMGYTLMGGMWSVTLTDAVQIALLLAGLVILGGVVLSELGRGNLFAGVERLWNETPAEKLVFVPRESAAAFWGWAGVLAAGALGNLPGQDLMQRVFAARSEQVARRSCYIAGVMYLAFGAIPVGLGLAVNVLPHDPEDAILPMLAHAFLSPPLIVVFVVALLSAVLSTIDSAILAPSCVLAQNIFARFTKVSPLRMNRVAVVLVTACSLALSYAGEGAYELLEGAYAITLTGLFVPLVLGLYFDPRSRHSATAAMVVGAGLWLVHYIAGWDHFLEFLKPLGRWKLSTSLSATTCSLLAYVACEACSRRRTT
ncbi:MAG: sodium:solute symporter family protein [Planctomycetes bacterium]|nr:sodium:solute symporter family protein [Planctomycetota bacterium]